ncbi:MAG: hypothetical protein KGQ46_05580 [Hyphomicrobiales bacterium]|nr:hypothetical protein [Hyphomicrobiales bacterium]MDE2115773.1 hypothetical protein [Hyphomicrobiales bacterium]
MSSPQEDSVENSEILALRREIYAKPSVSRADVENLLALGRTPNGQSPEFADLLAMAATDLLVNQPDPAKYITQADADWLMGHIGTGLSNNAEFEMLTDIIRYAISVPASLAAFTVSEIEKVIVGTNGQGAPADKYIDALKIAVYAATPESSLHVSRASAESLFEIVHASGQAASNPAFGDFFAKAIGNYLMGIAYHWTQSAKDKLEVEKFENAPSSFGDFIGSMFGGFFAGKANVHDAFTSAIGLDEREAHARNAADAAEAAQAAAIDPSETAWLMAHLARNAPLTAAERQLLQFLQQEAGTLPAPLEKLIAA